MSLSFQPVSFSYVFLKMFYNLNPVFLCFASEQDAKNFQAFVRAYCEENVGNGADVYIEAEDTLLFYANEIASFFVCSLNKKMIKKMAMQMARNRLDDQEVEVDITIVAEQQNGAIKFMISGIPERQRPGLGNACQLPSSENQGGYFRGRVVDDLGDQFLVQVLADFGPEKRAIHDEVFLPVEKVFLSFDHEKHGVLDF